MIHSNILTFHVGGKEREKERERDGRSECEVSESVESCVAVKSVWGACMCECSFVLETVDEVVIKMTHGIQDVPLKIHFTMKSWIRS